MIIPSRARSVYAYALISDIAPRELVAELTEQGMSTRAIAPIVGTSHMTVQNDLDAGVKRFTPAEAVPTNVPGLPVNPLTGEVYEAGDLESHVSDDTPEPFIQPVDNSFSALVTRVADVTIGILSNITTVMSGFLTQGEAVDNCLLAPVHTPILPRAGV